LKGNVEAAGTPERTGLVLFINSPQIELPSSITGNLGQSTGYIYRNIFSYNRDVIKEAFGF